MRKRDKGETFHVTGVVERLGLYKAADRPTVNQDEVAEPELVERAATLLSVMPRKQLRESFEKLLSPHDRERGRRAVDALIDAAFAIEDETGHLRRKA